MSGDTQRPAVTYRNLRATRAEPLAQPHTSQAEVLYIFQTCNFSAYLRTTWHSPVKTWQLFTTATFLTFSLLLTWRFVQQQQKLLVEFAETKTKMEQIRPVMYTADPHSLWTETVCISTLLPTCDSHAWLARIVLQPCGRWSDPPPLSPAHNFH